MTKTKDVFVSYSSADTKLAEAVTLYLEKNALACWIAPRDINQNAGKDYAQCLTEGIKTSRVMVLVFTKNSNGSKYVYKEIDQAIKNNIPVIPFRVDNIAYADGFDFYLDSIHYIDASRSSPQTHFPTLLTCCLQHLEKSPLPPPLPGKKPKLAKKAVIVSIGIVVLSLTLLFFYNFAMPNKTQCTGTSQDARDRFSTAEQELSDSLLDLLLLTPAVSQDSIISLAMPYEQRLVSRYVHRLEGEGSDRSCVELFQAEFDSLAKSKIVSMTDTLYNISRFLNSIATQPGNIDANIDRAFHQENRSVPDLDSTATLVVYDNGVKQAILIPGNLYYALHELHYLEKTIKVVKYSRNIGINMIDTIYISYNQ